MPHFLKDLILRSTTGLIAGPRSAIVECMHSNAYDHLDSSRSAGYLRIATLRRLLRAATEIESAWEGDRQTDPDLCMGRLRLLDVRSPESFCARHLPGSASLPAEELALRTPELPPKWRPFAVLAGDTATARRVAAGLRKRGWARAIHVSGGVDQWPGPWATGPATRVLWEPSPLVRAWAATIPSGGAIDLGCGSGRDAVYLAMQGHRVTAVDLLPDALEKAAALAGRCGVDLTLRQMDLRRQRPETQRPFDLVCMVRFLDRDLLAWCPELLAEGGTLLLEGFRQVGEDDPGPKRPGARLQPGEALRTAQQAGFEILNYRETRDRSGASIAQLVARKSAGR